MRKFWAILSLDSTAATARALPHREPFRVHVKYDDLSSFGLVSPDDRELDLGIKGDVEIVRKDIDRHIGSALRD